MTKYHAMLEAWRRGDAELAPVTGLMGMRLVGWEEGRAEVAMEVDQRHHNPHGTVHGGLFADLVDCACGCAVASVLADGESFTTLDLSLRYLRPVREATLTATVEVVRRGRRTAVLEGRVTDDEGRLVATASSGCLILGDEEG